MLEHLLQLRVTREGQDFFVECPYDLTVLDHPELGPYSNADLATRASEEIAQALGGSSE